MPRDVSQALLVVQLYQDPVGTLRVAGPHSLKRGEPAWKEATATPHDVAAWIKHARAQGWAPDSQR